MSKNEHTSKRVAKVAGRLLKTSKSSSVKKVSGSALTQARDKRSKKK